MAKRIILGVFVLLFLNINLSAKTSSITMVYLEGFLGKTIADLPKEALHPSDGYIEYFLEKATSNLSETIKFSANNENKIVVIEYSAQSESLNIIKSIHNDMVKYMKNKYSEYIYVPYRSPEFSTQLPYNKIYYNHSFLTSNWHTWVTYIDVTHDETAVSDKVVEKRCVKRIDIESIIKLEIESSFMIRVNITVY